MNYNYLSIVEFKKLLFEIDKTLIEITKYYDKSSKQSNN